MAIGDILISMYARKILSAKDALHARQVLNVQPLGWSWYFSDEPGGHHDGDRKLTTDTGRLDNASKLLLDSGFTAEPGGQGPETRWEWFAAHNVRGYAQLQGVNNPNAFAIYWVTSIEPYSYNTSPGAPVGDVDTLNVQPVDIDKAPRFVVGDIVNVLFIPVDAPS